MAWKKEYAKTRRLKAKKDPEYRKKRNAQSCKDREARKAYMKEYYANNQEKWTRDEEKNRKRNELRRLKYANDEKTREAAKAAAKKWQNENIEKRKAQRIGKYGLTYEDFVALLESQDGKCAICGHSDTSKKLFFPVIDHCHDTGSVRGILCANCNRGIGLFGEDIERLKSAIAYLESFVHLKRSAG